MKKIIALLMAVMLLVCCTACGESVQITRGTIDGNVYSSEFTGITFTKPDGWRYYSDEEIADSMGVAVDTLYEDSFAATVAETTSVFDMMVIDATTGTNINVTYENLSLSASTGISEEDYLDIVIEQVGSQTSITTELAESSTATLSGNEYLRATMNTSYSGISMTQVYYLRKIDNYMVSVIVTLIGDQTIEDIEAMFS